MVCGCFLMVRTTDFIAVDMFDNRTFLYGEEAILAERFKQILQKQEAILPSASVIHQQGKSSGISISNILRESVIFSRMLYWTDYKNINFWKIYMLRCSIVLNRFFAKIIKVCDKIKHIVNR